MILSVPLFCNPAILSTTFCPHHFLHTIFLHHFVHTFFLHHFVHTIFLHHFVHTIFLHHFVHTIFLHHFVHTIFLHHFVHTIFLHHREKVLQRRRPGAEFGGDGKKFRRPKFLNDVVGGKKFPFSRPKILMTFFFSHRPG